MAKVRAKSGMAIARKIAKHSNPTITGPRKAVKRYTKKQNKKK